MTFKSPLSVHVINCIVCKMGINHCAINEFRICCINNEFNIPQFLL
jgi:hypothetical protein